jgi:hypothetical protein
MLLKEIKKTFSKQVLNYDMFGAPILLEFHGAKDGVYQTFEGGVASIILNAFLLWLFIT